MKAEITLGYDAETDCIGKIRVDVIQDIHTVLCGQSGSGKSIYLLYLIYQLMSLDVPLELFICDPKNSGDFTGIVPPDHFATGMEESANMIHAYYDLFLQTPENNDTLRLLLIDEYAGLITSLPDIIGNKGGKAETEKIKSEMASIYMLSRSKRVGLWVVFQRPSASYFTASSGALDNAMIKIVLGKISTQTHIALFPNEQLENEEFAKTFRAGKGSGFVWIEGRPLKALKVPYISDKTALTKLLQHKARIKFGNF